MTAIRERWLPRGPREAYTAGWTDVTGGRPAGVTWHWTATRSLAEARALLGPGGSRRGQASAHLCVGRDAAEGVEAWVPLTDRAWHAGPGQSLDWRGLPSTEATKGTRTTVGIETVHVGYVRDDVPDEPGFLDAATPDGRPLRVPPWPPTQVALLVETARLVIARCPWLRPEDHHGHTDLCPRHKEDPAGFPFAEVLRRAYDDPGIPDVWTPFLTVARRRSALRRLGFTPGTGPWGPTDDAALRAFQARAGLTVDGCWTVWVGRAAWRDLGGGEPDGSLGG